MSGDGTRHKIDIAFHCCSLSLQCQLAQPPSSVLVITHRVMLGTEQSARMHAKWFRHGITEADTAVVVTLNSLVKYIKPLDRDWNVIIIDECDLVRKTFAASTMNSVRWETIEYLRSLLRKATLVVICQAEISDGCVGFYAQPMGIDTASRDHLTALKIVKPESMHPIEYSQDCAVVVQQLYRHLAQNLAPLLPSRQYNDGLDGLCYDPDPAKRGKSMDEIFLQGKKLCDIKVPKNRHIVRTAGEIRSDDNDSTSRVRPLPETVNIDQNIDQQTTDSTLTELADLFVPTYTLVSATIIFTTRKKFGTLLTSALKAWCVKNGVDPGCVRFISADTKNQGWHAQFCQNPSENCKDALILICTGVMGAGTSLDRHFPRFFGFLFNGVMDHVSELQFTARLR